MTDRNPETPAAGRLLHVVTLACKDDEHASRCLDALAAHGRPDALEFHCLSYEFGLKEGTADTVCIVERWRRWEDLDALLTNKVVPALPLYNELLRQPFDQARDTTRITLVAG
jgi:quinol monooxygenase YgiN